MQPRDTRRRNRIILAIAAALAVVATLYVMYVQLRAGELLDQLRSVETMDEFRVRMDEFAHLPMWLVSEGDRRAAVECARNRRLTQQGSNGTFSYSQPLLDDLERRLSLR